MLIHYRGVENIKIDNRTVTGRMSCLKLLIFRIIKVFEGGEIISE